MKNKIKQMNDVNIDHWESFYARNQNLEESSFCKEVRERIQEDTIVIDVGCGSGRDSFSFAAMGVDVFAIDRSHEAITANTQLAAEHSTTGELSFTQMDLSDEVKLNDFLAKVITVAHTEKKQVVFYLRFLLHAIDAVTEATLLDVISRNAPAGTYFVAEFRTKEDEDRSKTYDDHYRRFICTDEFLLSLEMRGFSIEEFYKGMGLSIYKEEDPFLARVIAKKD